MLSMKRVYEPPNAEDGFRVLVDALWPRGLSKEKALVDEWLRDIAPSTALRKSYHSGDIDWSEFKRRYLVELREPGRLEALARLKALIAQHRNVVLLFGSHQPFYNNAAVLLELLGEG